jgi:hypothetical protein
MSHNRKDKKRLRELKRKIKRSGNKKARADLKRDLATNPEEAHFGQVERGGRRSENLNGLDYDSKRKKKSQRRELYNQEDGGIIPPDSLEANDNGEESSEGDVPPVRGGEQDDG